MNPPEQRRHLSMPLLISLLLNVLLLGVLVTHWFHAGERRGGHRLPAGLPSIHGLSRELDAEARADFRQRFGGRREVIRSAMRDARESRRDVADALLAESFSADDLASAFEKQRQADLAVAAAIQRVLVDFAGAHGAVEREALLRTMSRDGRERGDRREPRRDREPSGQRPASDEGAASDDG
ncbi:MAG: periplasmic heavy metal sensor [Lysobacteraceae bacterium]